MIIRAQDNKILRNSSGELLAKSNALIDLRSTFGITKDGSNLVSQAKLFNNPSLAFIAPSGYEPTENGDGFLFDGTNDILIGGRMNIDYSNLFVGMWLKKSSYSVTNRLITSYLSTNNNNGFIFDFQSNILRLALCTDGTPSNLSTASYAVGSEYINAWVYVGFATQSIDATTLRAAIIINGVIKFMGDYTASPKSGNNIIVGRDYPSVARCINGNVDNVYVGAPWFEYFNNSVGDLVFSPPKRSSE